MSDAYPIIIVQPEWVLNPEDMGSKRKFWFQDEQERSWLFKYPQQNTGQHWAEKIAAELANALRIQHAKVELAEFEEQQGSATEKFTYDKRELIHGNQILAYFVQGYDPEKKFSQSSHTLKNIWQGIDGIFKESDAAERAKCRFAEYMILDALIGNTDRHHENWGVLRELANGDWTGFLAPSFDHASSLGRELQDVKRDRILTEGRIGEGYAEKGRGAVFWSEDRQHGPSPLELVRLATESYPGLFHPVYEKLRKLEQQPVKEIVSRISDDWMSVSAKQFAVALVDYNFGQLHELLS